MSSLNAHRHAKNLVDRGHAGAAFGDAVFDHRRHAFAPRQFFDFRAVAARAHALPDAGRDFENFEESLAAAIAGEAAPLAAPVMMEHLSNAKAEDFESFVAGDVL